MMENQNNQSQPNNENIPVQPVIAEMQQPSNQPVAVNTATQENLQQATKNKPPLAVQILFALSLCGLIIGILMAALLFADSSPSKSNSALMFSGLDNKVAAAAIAGSYLFLFILVNYVREMKLWALRSYTVIMGLLFVSTLYSYLTRSEIDKLLNHSSFIGTFLVYIIAAPLLIATWSKSRKQFS